MKKSLVLTAVAALLVGVFAGAFFTLHSTTLQPRRLIVKK